MVPTERRGGGDEAEFGGVGISIRRRWRGMVVGCLVWRGLERRKGSGGFAAAASFVVEVSRTQPNQPLPRPPPRPQATRPPPGAGPARQLTDPAPLTVFSCSCWTSWSLVGSGAWRAMYTTTADSSNAALWPDAVTMQSILAGHVAPPAVAGQPSERASKQKSDEKWAPGWWSKAQLDGRCLLGG